MTTPRLGAACGAVFAVGLFAANGDGSQAFSTPRAIAGIAALTLAIPFLAYVCSLLRAADGPNGWLAPTALAASVTGLALKLGSGAPELALHRANVAAGTPLYAAIEEIGNAATLVCLYPLAIFCAATAMIVFRTRVLPIWLGVLAAVTAVALAVNGGFVGTDAVPAMLLFVFWALVTSITLLIRPDRTRAAVTAGIPETVSID